MSLENGGGGSGAKLEKYSLWIDPALEQWPTGEAGAIAVMRHATPYCIMMRSDWSDRRCEAKISVDGMEVADLILDPSKLVRLERPEDDERRFTFFVGGSQQSEKFGYKRGRPLNGNVSVLFTPEHRPKRSTQMYVRSLTGQSVTIWVNLDEDTIADVKRLVEKERGVPMEYQRLIWAGKVLEDEYLLSHYNIRRESTMHVDSKLRGGGGCEVPPEQTNRMEAPHKRLKCLREGITGYTGRSGQRFAMAEWFRGDASKAKRLTVKLMGEGKEDGGSVRKKKKSSRKAEKTPQK